DVIEAQPLGSLRRRVSTIGDIDFGVTAKDPGKVIDYFLSYPYKERTIEKGPVSAAMLVSGGKQIDLITLPKNQWGSLLQHFTGSKNHNIHLRELALKKGMSLSERGIKIKEKGKEILKEFDTEEKFYKALGMDWIAPEMREDNGEIELALKHDLPKLVELSDIKADFHIHSSYPLEPSHDMGKNSMDEMIIKAKSLGYSYIGFSEHNPSQSKHTSKQIYEFLSRRKEFIEKLRSKHKGFGIVSLMETDILPNGSLALDDKALELLDGTIVSVHSVFSMDKKEMTKRVLQGLAHPKAKILAHPTGRLLNTRAGYELDFAQIFEFCKKESIAVEINAWPSRLDLPDSLVLQAVKLGVKMVIDTDAHASEQIDMMQYGVSVARRGWAKKSDILNYLSYNEFEQWLKS
ncbi:MAG TPA: PHP domain-containing protein, partial [Candidatus Saccharimonadales bacterium]|nr:PHP domain-containing protein [Candidatus Saccharimonadales bacterium]